MTDLTRPDNGEAMQRLTAKIEELGDELGAYLLLVTATLAHHAPDVLTFLLDRVDARLAAADEALSTSSVPPTPGQP